MQGKTGRRVGGVGKEKKRGEFLGEPKRGGAGKEEEGGGGWRAN